MASDSATLARWWARFCGGQVVSQASLDEMTANLPGDDRYGLGLMDEDGGPKPSIGHEGIQVGFAAFANCFLEGGLVVSVLTNHEEGSTTFDLTRALTAAVTEWDRRLLAWPG